MSPLMSLVLTTLAPPPFLPLLMLSLSLFESIAFLTLPDMHLPLPHSLSSSPISTSRSSSPPPTSTPPSTLPTSSPPSTPPVVPPPALEEPHHEVPSRAFTHVYSRRPRPPPPSPPVVRLDLRRHQPEPPPLPPRRRCRCPLAAAANPCDGSPPRRQGTHRSSAYMYMCT